MPERACQGDTLRRVPHVTVHCEISCNIGSISLDRPKARNAFDGAMVRELTRAFNAMAMNDEVRAIILRSEGEVFSAGADLAWMQRMAALSHQDNLADARQLAKLMRSVDLCPKPCIARIQGPALGGAVGLIACCDIAISVEDAVFGLSEVRLGLIPAVIGPYVLRAIGHRASRKLFLTGERITAAEALRLGLIHEAVPHDQLDDAIRQQADAVLAGGPQAQASAKALISDLFPIGETIEEMTVERIAAIRAGAEAREGLAAFLEKRKPWWAGP
jgi:methylglutaconyl-CoA hydratase